MDYIELLRYEYPEIFEVKSITDQNLAKYILDKKHAGMINDAPFITFPIGGKRVSLYSAVFAKVRKKYENKEVHNLFKGLRTPDGKFIPLMDYECRALSIIYEACNSSSVPNAVRKLFVEYYNDCLKRGGIPDSNYTKIPNYSSILKTANSVSRGLQADGDRIG